jgi:hypothetical protein
MKPSTLKIIRNDFLAYPTSIIPLMLWLLYFAVDLLPAWLNSRPVPLDPGPILLLVGVTLLSGLIIVWRVYTIRYVFENGTAAEAVIKNIWFFGSRGRLEVSYPCNGAPVDARIRILKNPHTQALTNSTQVSVVIDPEDPQRFFLQKLFL